MPFQLRVSVAAFVRKRRLRRFGQPRECASSVLGDTQLSRPPSRVNRYNSPLMSTSGSLLPELTYHSLMRLVAVDSA